MARFLLRRLVALGVTLLFAAAMVFAVLEILPGDPAATMLGVSATPETVAALRAELGLDRPVSARFWGWVSGFFTGDVGISYAYRVPVGGLIAERMAVAVPLAFLSLALVAVVGILLGSGLLD